MMNNQHLQQYMEQKICSKFLFALKQIASQTNKKPLVVSISKSEVSKYRTVNDCETRRRQPLALVFKALWAKWWRWQSDQICRWIYKSSIVDIVFAIIVSQAFLYYTFLCAAIWLTARYCCDEQKSFPMIEYSINACWHHQMFWMCQIILTLWSTKSDIDRLIYCDTANTRYANSEKTESI